jgi:hypothetical protein
MFPDVFSGDSAKQEMQLNMFYDDRDRGATQSRPAVKSLAKGKTHVFGQVEPPTGHASAPYNCNVAGAPSTGVVTGAAGVVSTRQQHSSPPVQTSPAVSPVSIPPLRRVVKVTLTSRMTSSIVVICFVVNTLLVLVVPESITPRLGTLWGSFLYLWLLITITQMISHAVYLCSEVSLVCSVLNLFLVSASAVLLPRSLFMKWPTLAPCMSFAFLVYQCHLFCLVYSHLRRRFMYIIPICLVTLLPMTQVIHQAVEPGDSMLMYTLYSLMTIGTLYGIALTNNYKSEIVDISIGTSPLWQPDE